VTAIYVAGVRGDPCGAVRWTVQRTAPQFIMHFFTVLSVTELHFGENLECKKGN